MRFSVHTGFTNDREDDRSDSRGITCFGFSDNGGDPGVRAGHRRAHTLDTTTRSPTAAGQAIQSIPARNCKNMASLSVPEFVSWCSLVSAPAQNVFTQPRPIADKDL